jgi:transposase-like protein
VKKKFRSAEEKKKIINSVLAAKAKHGTFKDACKSLGYDPNQVHRWIRVQGEDKSPRITVQKIQSSSNGGNLFAIFGSPKLLAEMVREMS